MKCQQPGCEEAARPNSNYCSQEHCVTPARGDKMVDLTRDPGRVPEKWKTGDQRLVRRISLLPRCVHGCWYWLSLMYVVQEYWQGSRGYTWRTKRWLAKKPPQFSRFSRVAAT